MQGKDTKKGILWHLLVFCVAVSVIGGILFLTGTITSGFHFLDDHEVVRFSYRISVKGKSIWEILSKQIQTDFKWRYRPVYWIERIGLSAVFGSNMLYWNVYTCVKGIFTFVLLCFFAYYLRCDKVLCLLFPCVVMLGAQFTPWYRSANQENSGLLLCAVALFLIAWQNYHGKYKSKCLDLCICITVILCGMVKESFTLFCPLFLWLKFWLQAETFRQDVANQGRDDSADIKFKEPATEKSGEKTIFSTCKACFWQGSLFYIPTIISLLINVGVILFYVKTDQVSYAGFEKTTALTVYLKGILNSLFSYTMWYTVFGIFVACLMLWCARKQSKEKRNKGVVFATGILMVLAVQLVAHAKSMMWERYIIPYILGWAILFILFGHRVIAKGRGFKAFFCAAVIVLILVGTKQSITMAKAYAYDGKMISSYFATILEQTKEDDFILTAFTDRELNLSTETYLQTHGRTKTGVYLWESDEFSSIVRVEGKKPKKMNWDKAKIIVCYPESVSEIKEKMGLFEDNLCETKQFSRYCVIVRQ